jgi:chromosome partition protein MukB
VSRTTADALALVNWKGVFYARYGLDRHVTALEGANGAGKTTVMIAAYVVLLPDMSRLRFTNLGETGATGGDKGIWGRLGEAGRPSYAVLDFALPGKRRLVAGVHLERKGEPSVEPTPFIVSGLAADVRLQDLLLVKLGASEVVPELPELRENAARLGGRLQSFTSARDYFAALFDHGVTPLRLGTDEERNKLNEMLRTSMTGGISRALTSELRSFVLKEEVGLADTLQRMRANLDACRRTRTEVQEARRLEHEIGGVFEAGQAMFAAALLATRERAEELTRRVEDAEAVRGAGARARDAAQDALDQTLGDLDTLQRRRGEIGAVLEAARTWYTRLRDALVAANQLVGCLERLTRAQATAREAERRRDAADVERTRTRDELRRAQDGYRRAAEGLADLQQGIQELHRRAGGYLQANRRLREAEETLGGVSVQALAERSTQAREELSAVDDERREATTRHADAEAHRGRHAEVMKALRVLLDGDVDVAIAYESALSALQEHRHRVVLAGRTAVFERDLAEARKQAARQSSVRERARQLGVELGDEPAGQLVARVLGDVETELKEHEERERTAKTSVQQTEGALKELGSRRRALAEREPAFRDLATRANRLVEHLATTVDSRATLDAARVTLDVQLTGARKDENAASEEHEALLRQARDLLAQGGPFDPDLLRLKDQLGAELVAASFEDVELDAAGRVEARLGPLVQALVVDDPKVAARNLGARPDSIADVLLVSRDADLEKIASATNIVEVADGDIAVDEGLALRVSRIPSQPRLGRRAREARAAELRVQAEAKSGHVEEARARRRQIQRLVADGEALLAGHATWLAGDPASELAEVKRAIGEAEAQLAQHRVAIERHGESARALRPRVSGLRTLLAEALLLDPPDHGERSRALEQDLQAARTARDMVARHKTSAEIVDRHQADLRQLPLSDEELIRLGERVQHLKNRRERLQTGLDATEYVRANIEALGWEDAPRRLAHEQALVPALKEQLGEAKTLQAAAETSATNAEQHFNDDLAAFQDTDGEQRLAGCGKTLFARGILLALNRGALEQ